MVGEQVVVKNKVPKIVETVMVMVVVEAFLQWVPPFGRNNQVSEQSTLHGRGRELNHDSPLSLRGRGWAFDSMLSSSSPMQISGRG